MVGEVSTPTTSLSQSMQGLPSMEVESDVGAILDEQMHGCTMGLQSERDEERERERERERENGITARSSESLDVPLAVT